MSTLLKTNSKVYRERIYTFLLESIEFEDLEGAEITNRQKIDYFFSEFESIANYPNNIRKFPNEQNRLADYLQGLPSSLQIPFYNYDILNLVKELHGVKELTEKQEDTILANYWNHISFMLISLRKKLSGK